MTTLPLPTSITRAPQQVRSSLTPGTPWPGVQVRETNPADLTHPDLRVTASIRTAPSPSNPSSFFLADCTIGDKDTDGYYSVTLDGASSLAFPIRALFCSVMASTDLDAGTDPVLLMQVTIDVVTSTYSPPAP